MKGKKNQKDSEIIDDLRRELAEREQDLLTYRSELESANKKIEGLIAHLSEELQQLTRLQHVLVPTELPHISGFELSSKFQAGSHGGDYFDIFEHEDKMRFGVILSHCSGYVASALFLSVVLKLTGQMEARRLRHSDEIIKQLDQELASQMSAQDHAHVFYGAVDRRTFELEYSAAGGHILLHWQHHAQKLVRLPSESQTLPGLSTAERKTVTLGPRDRLFFATPGCVRAQNSDGEVFGDERLYRCVLESLRGTVHEARNEIFYQLQRFQQGQPVKHDQTVLVLEVKDRVIRLTKS
jgi:sigma-B regulation protein RsbU (phosphoserine phosphatase)